MTPSRLLDIGPGADERLQRALLTSFEAPDATLLTDRLLPALLDLPPIPDREDKNGFARAQTALCQALAPLRGRIVIVSSSRGEWEPHWLTSYLRFRRTGADAGGVVQHAKLWMLHWMDSNGRERLELVVSSANLTRNGIDEQIQGAWRASVRLGARTRANRKSWGPLPPFLDRLGISCAQPQELEQFSNLLERAACPRDVRFVATAPADGNWGAESLKDALDNMMPKQVRILTPFTGGWRGERLAGWLKDSGCAGARVELVAASSTVRVPESTQWILAEHTRNELFGKVDFGLLTAQASCDLRGGTSADEDRRWAHAKLYEFRRGRSSALLVTSANFTPTAWHDGGNGNFELGVLLLGQALPITFEHAETIDEVAVRGETQMRGETPWAEAQWDGREIMLRIRAGLNGTLEVSPKEGCTKLTPFRAKPGGLTTVRLPHTAPVPTSVRIAFGPSHFTIPVIDVRINPEALPVGELSDEDAQAWKDRLLLEKYGAAVDEEGTGRQAHKGKPNGAGGAGDYSLPVLEDARAWFGYVDNWDKAYAEEATTELSNDGKRLLRYFERVANSDGAAGHIARAVVDELSVRLDKVLIT